MKDLHEDKSIKPLLVFSNEVIRHHAKSFSFAARFLPKKKRCASAAVYSFCRHADNIVDKKRERTAGQIAAELECLRRELVLAYRTGESEHPSIGAFIRTAMNYEIPQKYPLELLKGVESDLNKETFSNFDGLYLYCYRVASCVGLMMTHILGFSDKSALEYAEKLGAAMQLTNILRDITEDAADGRIYLPEDEMKRFGISKDDIFKQKFTADFYDFMVFQAERAAKYYEESLPGIKLLDKDSRFAIFAAAKIYGRILKKIEQQNYNPFTGRAFVPKSEKIKIVFAEYFKTKFA